MSQDEDKVLPTVAEFNWNHGENTLQKELILTGWGENFLSRSDETRELVTKEHLEQYIHLKINELMNQEIQKGMTRTDNEKTRLIRAIEAKILEDL